MTDASNRENLLQKSCVPCEGGVPKLTLEQAADHLLSIPGWILTDDGGRIRRNWIVKNFMEAIHFFNAIAQLAEAEGHHPDLQVSGYRNVTVEIWTHAIGGLSENDFILAAKIDNLPIKLHSS